MSARGIQKLRRGQWCTELQGSWMLWSSSLLINNNNKTTGEFVSVLILEKLCGGGGRCLQLNWTQCGERAHWRNQERPPMAARTHARSMELAGTRQRRPWTSSIFFQQKKYIYIIHFPHQEYPGTRLKKTCAGVLVRVFIMWIEPPSSARRTRQMRTYQ